MMCIARPLFFVTFGRASFAPRRYQAHRKITRLFVAGSRGGAGGAAGGHGGAAQEQAAAARPRRAAAGPGGGTYHAHST